MSHICIRRTHFNMCLPPSVFDRSMHKRTVQLCITFCVKRGMHINLAQKRTKFVKLLITSRRQTPLQAGRVKRGLQPRSVAAAPIAQKPRFCARLRNNVMCSAKANAPLRITPDLMSGALRGRFASIVKGCSAKPARAARHCYILFTNSAVRGNWFGSVITPVRGTWLRRHAVGRGIKLFNAITPVRGT